MTVSPSDIRLNSCHNRKLGRDRFLNVVFIDAKIRIFQLITTLLRPKVILFMCKEKYRNHDHTKRESQRPKPTSLPSD